MKIWEELKLQQLAQHLLRNVEETQLYKCSNTNGSLTSDNKLYGIVI